MTAPTAKVTAATFDLVVALEADVVGDQHQSREGDAEAGEDDVKAQRERHLAAGWKQLGGCGQHVRHVGD